MTTSNVLRSICAACVLALSVPSAEATVIHVPGDAATIQAGIGLAQPGDTVMVAAGTYLEHIQLRSGISVIGADAATTIIDGQGMSIDIVQAVSLTNVLFKSFTVRGAVSGGGLPGGAGVFVNLPSATVKIEDVIATDNDFGLAVFNGFNHNGPDFVGCSAHDNNFWGVSDPGNGLLTGCLIYANMNGIVQAGNSCHPQIVNNTVWGNMGNGFDYWNDVAPTVRNNIFAGNGAYGIRERAPGTFVDPIVEYNLFWDNGTGNYWDVQPAQVRNTEDEINGMPNAEFNIVADPLLCDPPADFHLCFDSPAAGAGQGGADIGALGVGCGACGTVAVDEMQGITPEGLGLTVYPNPFSPAATIEFSLSTPGHAVLRVHDLEGRVVCTLHDGALASGAWRFAWDGRTDSGTELSAGTYMLDLRVDDVQVARKITRVDR